MSKAKSLAVVLEEAEPHVPAPGHPDHGDNPNRLTNWFPLVPKHIPVPKTRIVTGIDSRTVMKCMDGDAGAYAELEIAARLVQSAGDEFGWPCFLRTDITSCKHSWERTCFLAKRDLATVIEHVCAIVEDAECMMAPFSKALVVREMLPTVTAFTAFHGRMPITRERRYFVEGGKVRCSHAYWPAESIKGSNPSVRCWRKALAGMDAIPRTDAQWLKAASAEVSFAIPGYWSVDWLWTTRGWFLIDMALGDDSWHWPKCKAARKP